MTPEQRARAQEIALVALGLDPSERDPYLIRRAAGEPEVLAEVRRRLALAGEIPEAFLDVPAGLEPGVDEQEEPTELGEMPFAEGRRYRLVELLGAGGMGRVFRAHDRRLDRQVAIKRLHPELAPRAGALERFEREARVGARLSHPAIVQIFDVLRDRDQVWIVMELVAGRSLSSRLAEGRLELAEALGIAIDIAAGLAAAHEMGVLHRDLKASNVMLTPDGHAKILDFGLATLTSSGEPGPGDGGLHGTPAAMSPEQVACCRLDTRSDLFSFGSLLYRMVTGEAPFGGPSPLVVLDRVRRMEPPPAKRLDPTVPEELSALIEELLEKDPERRPRDASRVRRALEQLADRVAGPAALRPRRAPAPSSAAGIPSAGAERRRVTLLSCQLMAAGRTGALLDPEELLAIEGPLRELARDVVGRRNGHLEGWLDGGLRACFGFPRAREDDAHRAVAAGLELADVAGWTAGPQGSRLRVGVHTGRVVVIAGRDGRRQIVVGRTGCCATHLRTAEARLPSGPPAVLVSSAVRELVGGRFRCEPLGRCSVGLCEAPLEAFLVRREPGASAAAPETTPPTAFTGREAELALLRRRWRSAASGGGQVVLVSGEAGSGKTRLLQELRALPALAEAGWLELACQPAALRRRLAELLGSANPGEEEADVLVSRLAERAARAPAVLVIDGVHRGAPDDLDLLALLIDQAPALPLLILVTCQPPFEAPWRTPLHLTTCSLGPLTGGQGRQMIRELGGGALTAAEEEEILLAADGVPRFVEELTRMFVRLRNASQDAGAPASPEPQGGEPPTTNPPSPVPVPATLASWLTARRDRLGEPREVARAASVLGREFTREQLLVLLPEAGDAVERGLGRLVEDEFLQRRGGRRSGRYRFRYALDRSAAWESLLRGHRELYLRRVPRARAGA